MQKFFYDRIFGVLMSEKLLVASDLFSDGYLTIYKRYLEKLAVLNTSVGFSSS